MKKICLILCLISSSSLVAAPIKCTCTSGDMTVEIEGGKTKMSCSDGGKVSCELR